MNGRPYENDDEEFRWIALSAAIRNVVAFLEAQRELVRKPITLDGHEIPACAASSETAGDLSESRPFRWPTGSPSDEVKVLLPTASTLGGGGETPPAANSAGLYAESKLKDCEALSMKLAPARTEERASSKASPEQSYQQLAKRR